MFKKFKKYACFLLLVHLNSRCIARKKKEGSWARLRDSNKRGSLETSGAD